MLSNDRFLFISAHPDDTELSAGGLVHFLARHGKTVKILILSNPSISLPSGYTNNTLIDEQTAAAAELKIGSKNNNKKNRITSAIYIKLIIFK